MQGSWIQTLLRETDTCAITKTQYSQIKKKNSERPADPFCSRK